MGICAKFMVQSFYCVYQKVAVAGTSSNTVMILQTPHTSNFLALSRD